MSTSQPISSEPSKIDDSSEKKEQPGIEALSDNKVDVEIEPDVKSNDVKLSLCSLSCVFNCFSGNKPETAK